MTIRDGRDDGRGRGMTVCVAAFAAVAALCMCVQAADGTPPPEAPGALSAVWNAVQECFRTVFAPLNRALRAIPVSTARWVAVAYIVLGGLWTFLLPRQYIYEGAPSRARWRDLRLWAVAFLVPFALIYLFW